jgi:hypothetical protein
MIAVTGSIYYAVNLRPLPCLSSARSAYRTTVAGVYRDYLAGPGRWSAGLQDRSRHPPSRWTPQPGDSQPRLGTPSRASARGRGYINLSPVQQLHATSAVGRGVDPNGALAYMESCPRHHGCACQVNGPGDDFADSIAISRGVSTRSIYRRCHSLVRMRTWKLSNDISATCHHR